MLIGWRASQNLALRIFCALPWAPSSYDSEHSREVKKKKLIIKQELVSRGGTKIPIGFLGTHKGLFYTGLGNLTGALITGGFWLFLAYLQSPEEYGMVSYAVSIASLASTTALVGMHTAVTTYSAKGSETIVVQANQVILISAIVAAIPVSILQGWMSGLFVIGMAFWMMTLYDLLGAKAYSKYALVNIGARALQFILSIVLYLIMGVSGIILGFAISFMLFSYRYFSTIRRFDFHQFGEVRKIMKFAWHTYSFTMANAFFMYVDKLIAVPLFGYLVLGYYQIAFQFLMFLGMIPISFYQYLLPEQSAAQSPGSARNKMSSVQAFGFILAASLAILMFFLGPIIIPIIFENFSESSDAIRIMSIGIVPMMLVWNLNSRFTSMGNTRFVFIGSMLYLVVQIGLMVSLGSVLGATGIALATVAGLSSQGLFLFALAYRQCR